MSFDGQTASTLDLVDIAIPSPRRKPRRAQSTNPDASTVEDELVAQVPMPASDSSIDPLATRSPPPLNALRGLARP